MNFKFENASGDGVRNRNKGAISLEYILVVVLVVLVCFVGMKVFGGRIGNTINGSKDAVVNTTNNVFNELNETGNAGSDEEGGSGETNTPGGDGSSTIDMSNINTTLASGDFSTKGNLVTVNGRSYRVLESNGTQAKLLAMDSYKLTGFGSNSTYFGSNLDNEMANFYNSLPAKLQNAIVEQNISQSRYSSDSGTNASADFSAWRKNSFTEATTSGNNYYLIRTTEVNVGARKVFALDVDDVISYLGSTSTPQDVNELFFGVRNKVNSDGVWLRSALSGYDRAFFVYGDTGGLDFTICRDSGSVEVRPAFVLDLSLLS